MTGAAPPPGAELAEPGGDGLTGDGPGAGELARRLGIEVVERSPDRVVATMPVVGNRQPLGLLHGGASCVLAETLGSVAATLDAGPGRVAVGIELNATHHRAVREGIVRGECTPLHRGRTVATYAITITDSSGRLVCSSRLTCALRDTQPS